MRKNVITKWLYCLCLMFIFLIVTECIVMASENDDMYVYPIVPNPNPELPVGTAPSQPMTLYPNQYPAHIIFPNIIDKASVKFSYYVPSGNYWIKWELLVREADSDIWITMDEGGAAGTYFPVYGEYSKNFDLSDFMSYPGISGRSKYELMIRVTGVGSGRIYCNSGAIKVYSDYITGTRSLRISVEQVQPSLISSDHTSEGFLVTAPNGNILHIFRLAPGPSGDHRDNNSYIALRRKTGGVWGQPILLYNDPQGQYDDRNVHGGITYSGRIVAFFLSCDSINEDSPEQKYMYSDDNGYTWSGPFTMPDPIAVWGTGHMFYLDDIGKYCVLGYGRDNLLDLDGPHTKYLYARFSTDGSAWLQTESKTIDNIFYGEEVEFETPQLSEISGAYCKNGKIICLVRNGDLESNPLLQYLPRKPFLQYVSYNYGQTWEVDPINDPYRNNNKTDINIIGNHWACAPQLFYDESADLLVAITTDRRSIYEGPDSYDEERIYIYTAKPDEVFGNPKGWSLEYSFIRPRTDSGITLYGYPTVTKIGSTSEYNEYLVVFTERTNDVNEDTDFYEFTLRVYKNIE